MHSRSSWRTLSGAGCLIPASPQLTSAAEVTPQSRELRESERAVPLAGVATPPASTYSAITGMRACTSIPRSNSASVSCIRVSFWQTWHSSAYGANVYTGRLVGTPHASQLGTPAI